MKPYRAHYIDTIQLAANSYLCFPTAPEKERKEKKTNDVDVGQNFCLKMNLADKPSNIEYDILPTFLMSPDYVNN